jgi:FkbM family methyltransferase
MKIRKFFKNIISKSPALEGFIRFKVLSKIKYPEIELLYIKKQLLADNKSIAIDIGAAEGYYVSILSKKYKRVLAFEPLPEHMNILSSFTPRNVELYSMAVSDANGSAWLSIPRSKNGDYIGHEASLNKMGPDESRNILVQTTRLDDFLSNKNLDVRVGCIKIDVEGHEHNVLIGAEATLRKWFPVVICEIEFRHSDKVDKTFELMGSIGYTAYYTIDGYGLKEIGVEELKNYQTQDRLNARCEKGHNVLGLEYINNIIFIKD